MRKLRVAMLAPPWLRIPPKGYGGIEVVLYDLIRGLKDLDIEVEVFSVRQTKIPGIKVRGLYKKEQYGDIHHPTYNSAPIIFAHLQYALNFIRKDGGFDIIHDHNGYFGPSLLEYASQMPDIPPVIHTIHGPPFTTQQMLDQGLPDNRIYWKQLNPNKRFYVVPISHAFMKSAPAKVKKFSLKPVHNALDVDLTRFQERKQPFFITLARFSRDKGQHLAAKFCTELKMPLRMAGTVAGISTARELNRELANPLSVYRADDDFRYYSDKVLKYTLDNPRVRYVGNLSGAKKRTTVAQAKALLFPIDWEEPFGMAVIEALASGTPVVAMNRGAMPEIIEHGKTGFLANTKAEFKEYMQRVDEIDPHDCRASIEKNFSADKMAQDYLDRYGEVIRLAK